jgi:hypothetical protein
MVAVHRLSKDHTDSFFSVVLTKSSYYLLGREALQPDSSPAFGRSYCFLLHCCACWFLGLLLDFEDAGNIFCETVNFYRSARCHILQSPPGPKHSDAWRGTQDSIVVKALSYKPEGRGIETR